MINVCWIYVVCTVLYIVELPGEGVPGPPPADRTGTHVRRMEHSPQAPGGHRISQSVRASN